MRWLLPLVLLVGGCGAKTGLDDSCEEDDIEPRFELGPETPECVTDWRQCRPVGEPVVVHEGATSPDIAWGRGELLVVSTSVCAVSVSGIHLDRGLRWRKRVGETSRARVAFSAALAAGIVALEGSLHWLGADGQPLPSSLPLEVEGEPAGGEVFATARGLGLMTGRSDSDLLRPLWYAEVPPSPGPLAFIDLGVEHVGLPEAARDADGLVRFVATSESFLDHARLWDFSGARPELLEEPEVFPAWGRVVAVAEIEGDAHSLSVSGPFDELDHQMIVWMARWGMGSLIGHHDVFVGVPRGNDYPSALQSVGGRLYLASPGIHPAGVLSIAPVDTITAYDELGEVIPLASGDGLVGAPRTSHTPRGFAVAWARRPSSESPTVVLVQRVDCCTE